MTPDFFYKDDGPLRIFGNSTLSESLVFYLNSEGQGILLNGKEEGYSVDIDNLFGVKCYGYFVHGERNGPWTMRNRSRELIAKGSYLNGKQNGEWTLYKNGQIMEKRFFE